MLSAHNAFGPRYASTRLVCHHVADDAPIEQETQARPPPPTTTSGFLSPRLVPPRFMLWGAYSSPEGPLLKAALERLVSRSPPVALQGPPRPRWAGCSSSNPQGVSVLRKGRGRRPQTAARPPHGAGQQGAWRSSLRGEGGHCGPRHPGLYGSVKGCPRRPLSLAILRGEVSSPLPPLGGSTEPAEPAPLLPRPGDPAAGVSASCGSFARRSYTTQLWTFFVFCFFNSL